MNLEQRVQKLERVNRMLIAGGTALFLALAVVLGVANTKPNEALAADDGVADVLRAKAFHVVGEDGRPLVKIERVGKAGWITTLNSDGKKLFTLGQSRGGGGMASTWNGNGGELVRLANTHGGEGGVLTFNGKGTSLVQIGATEPGEGAVTTLNSQGVPMVRVTAGPRGHGLIATLNKKGEELVVIGELRSGVGALAVKDPTGKTRAAILMPK